MTRRVRVSSSTAGTLRETVAHAVERATSTGSMTVRLVAVLDRDGPTRPTARAIPESADRSPGDS